MLSGKPKRMLLVDCNNFFVSCERVFNPALIGKPVVVLSSNDGCVIARSNEAKALDIPMGAPAFQYEHLFKKYNIHVYSSNFSLYGDMSSRVMQALATEATDIEVYSVDEAFLHIVDLGHEDDAAYFAARAQLLIRKVKQHTGIPISIGIAPTKTLAKIANKIAKKNPGLGGYFDITGYAHMDALLEKIAVGDIWGVGRRYARMLNTHGITTARALRDAPDEWVRKKMTINGLKMVHELRAIPCFALHEEIAPNKSMTVSRSFGKAITDLQYLEQAAATHATTAARKLRAQGLCAAHVTIFVLFRDHQIEYRSYDSASFILPVHTHYTPDFIAAAKVCVNMLYKPGIIYKKVGIILNDLVDQESVQMNMYHINAHSSKQDQAMQAHDQGTAKWGIDKLTFAATGNPADQPWKPKKERKSGCFTTSWHELLEIKG